VFGASTLATLNRQDREPSRDQDETEANVPAEVEARERQRARLRARRRRRAGFFSGSVSAAGVVFVGSSASFDGNVPVFGVVVVLGVVVVVVLGVVGVWL
jgi:hypothetical protein